MKLRSILLGFVAAASMFAVGCSTAPKTEEGKDNLQSNVDNTLKALNEKDPGLQAFLDKADAYVIFPSVGKGGLVIGGSFGRGIVYEHGKAVGYADISQATVGAQIGGQEFTEILAFESDEAFQSFKKSELKFTAQATAVALKSGAAANAKFTNHVAVFVDIKSGLMAEAAIGGQSFSYQPM